MKVDDLRRAVAEVRASADQPGDGQAPLATDTAAGARGTEGGE